MEMRWSNTLLVFSSVVEGYLKINPLENLNRLYDHL